MFMIKSAFRNMSENREFRFENSLNFLDFFFFFLSRKIRLKTWQIKNHNLIPIHHLVTFLWYFTILTNNMGIRLIQVMSFLWECGLQNSSTFRKMYLKMRFPILRMTLKVCFYYRCRRCIIIYIITSMWILSITFPGNPLILEQF